MHRPGVIRWAVVGSLLALSAPASADEPKRLDIKHLSCEGFLAEPPDVQPMIAAWVHGYTRAGGENWVLEEGAAHAFVAAVQDRCQKNPKASFRYQVMDVAKAHQAEAKKAAAAKK